MSGVREQGLAASLMLGEPCRNQSGVEHLALTPDS
jgi:hypothetical protein